MTARPGNCASSRPGTTTAAEENGAGLRERWIVGKIKGVPVLMFAGQSTAVELLSGSLQENPTILCILHTFQLWFHLAGPAPSPPQTSPARPGGQEALPWLPSPRSSLPLGRGYARLIPRPRLLNQVNVTQLISKMAPKKSAPYKSSSLSCTRSSLICFSNWHF